MKYTVIKSEEQYEKYCDKLEELVFSDDADEFEDEIELLTVLIEEWEEQPAYRFDMGPAELLHSLMKAHGLNQSDLAEIADVGRSYMSEILNHRKPMSKKVIRRLSDYFKIRQEALNREPHSIG